ncbi:MAG: response regulator transcription factor [Humibacillus sp.]|nr:response regulator transcription factor [Humibacillus sp.]MDN5775843.1 response regulator transcription factor [Humibacillus sp.]
MTGNTIRVVVADDQTVIREALAMMLDLEDDIDVVATAENGAVAVERVLALRPDVLLTDLRMPVMDGAAATAQVAERAPDTAVIVLTTFDDEASILSALQAGARGYLTKDAGRGEIAAAIRAAAAGQSVLDRAVQARLVSAAVNRSAVLASPTAPPAAGSAGAPTTSAVDGLTPRESEVLALIAEGLSNREIARRLFVSEATVKTHINNLFAKAHLRDRAHAVSYAYTHGLVTP